MQGSDDALDEPLSDIAGVGREAGLHILFDIRLLLRLLLWLLWSMIKSQLSNPQNWALTNGSSDAVTLSRVSQPYQRSTEVGGGGGRDFTTQYNTIDAETDTLPSSTAARLSVSGEQ